VSASLTHPSSPDASGARNLMAAYHRADFTWRKHPDGWALHNTDHLDAILDVVRDGTYPRMWRVRLSDGRLSDMANLTWARDGAIEIALTIKSLVGVRYSYRLCTLAMSNLNAEKAFIFRIVHRDNVPWMLDHGLHCQELPDR
jgi:hypothetical protein